MIRVKTQAEARALGLPDALPKRSKYRAVPTVYNGVRYASKAEARQAKSLDAEILAGSVDFYIRQPAFYLGCPENKYVADFLVFGLGEAWVIDVKGFKTAKFRRDEKLWRAYGPCNLEIVHGEDVEIIPGGRDRRHLVE